MRALRWPTPAKPSERRGQPDDLAERLVVGLALELGAVFRLFVAVFEAELCSRVAGAHL